MSVLDLRKLGFALSKQSTDQEKKPRRYHSFFQLFMLNSDSCSGPFCEEDVDECNTAIDQPASTGNLSKHGRQLHLHLRAGMDGRFCDINKDDCAAEPCMNGGTCTDKVATFRCECPPGKTGEVTFFSLSVFAFSVCLHSLLWHQYRWLCPWPLHTWGDLYWHGGFIQLECPSGKTGEFTCFFLSMYSLSQYVYIRFCDINIDDCALTPACMGGLVLTWLFLVFFIAFSLYISCFMHTKLYTCNVFCRRTSPFKPLGFLLFLLFLKFIFLMFKLFRLCFQE